MKKKWIAVAVALVVLIGGIFGYQQFKKNQAKKTTTTGVRTTTVKKGLLQETVSGSGNVQAMDKSDIKNKIKDSYLVEQLYKDGQEVKAGTVLYRFSNNAVLATLQQARLDLALAQNDYDKVVRQNSSAASTLRDAELKVANQQVNYDSKQGDLEALKVYAGWDGTVTNVFVHQGDDVTTSSSLLTVYDAARANQDGLDYQAKLLQARATRDARKQDVANLTVRADFDGQVTYVNSVAGDDVTTSSTVMTIRENNRLQNASDDVKTNIQKAQLAVQTKADDVANLELRAPATGKLTSLNIEVGDTAAANALVGSIGDTRQVKATVNVPQNLITGVVKGAQAQVTLTGTATTYYGRVTDISANWVTQGAFAYYPVEVTMDNDSSLLAGMTVNVSIQSTDTSVGWISAIKGSLTNATQKEVRTKINGDVIAVYANTDDWVTEGQVLAVLKNDSAVMALAQAKEDLRKLESTDVKPKVSGKVSQILVAEGSAVKKGQPLLVLKNDAVLASANQAQVDLDRLESGDIKPKVSGTITNIYVQPGQSVKAGTLLMDIKNDTVTYAAQKASFDLTAAKNDLASVLSNQAASAIEVARLKVENQKVNLEAKQTDYDGLTITAPIDGKVYSKQTNLKKGDMLDSIVVLATIYNMNGMQLVANMDELDVARIQVGQTATVTVDALSGRTYKAKVSKISEEGTVKDAVATFPVTLDIQDPQLIKPAMTATANIVVASKDNVIAVARDAVKRNNGQATVTVLENGKQVARPVKTGIQTTTQVEITEGLNDGDVVVTGGSSGGLNIGGARPAGGGMPTGAGGPR